MMSKANYILFSILLFLLFNGCQQEVRVATTPASNDTVVNKQKPVFSDTLINGKRILLFSGLSWVVGSSADLLVGPGPNTFSDSKENVWLDVDGRLHLKITKRNNKWYCASVSLMQSYGHKRYLFYLDSRLDNLDKNVVGGLFTYQSDTEEIDIEFSKWGVTGSPNSQFTVQPSSIVSNKKSYNITSTSALSTHWFNWQSSRIDFASFSGHSSVLPAAGNIWQQWTYTGSSIPPVSTETLKINLWLYRGIAPSDNQEVEMIVSGVSIL